MTTLIFDGHNTFLRNFVVNPTADNNGQPIGGVMGTLKSLKYMIRETGADRVIWVWDGPGGSRRRRGIIGEYKAGRKPRLNRSVDEETKDSRDNIVWQMDKTRLFLGFLGVSQLQVPDIEADDAIAYLCGALDPRDKVVVSSDRDMWQLVSPTTTVYWPVKKVYITPGNFGDNSPFHRGNYVLARALSGEGDTSDNIHGIKGLGAKTILKIWPELAKEPIEVGQFFAAAKARLADPSLKLTPTQKKWNAVVLENEELVRRNHSVMQLETPEISIQAASTIRNAMTSAPKFNITGFKLAVLQNGLVITDSEFFTTFQEYRTRAENSAGQP